MSFATLINCFEVAPEQDQRFLQLWRQADDLLRGRGGYRSTRLHRALGPQARFRYVNVAELDSVEAWQSAVSSPEFTAIAAQMADFSPSPGLYTVEVTHSTAEQEQDR
ncbi:antibiotic biosynthesis monooxygenase family protein [Geodermatophilus sp. URMC 63]